MTTGKLAVLASALVALVALTLGAVVGLTIANRSTAAVFEIVALVVAPTITGLGALIGVKRVGEAVDQVHHDLHNGLQDEIAGKVAGAVAVNAAAVAAELAAAPSSSSGGVHAP